MNSFLNVLDANTGRPKNCLIYRPVEDATKVYTRFKIYLHSLTGYNQSITGCGSLRSQCSCYSTKTYVGSMILILKLNLTSLRNIYIKVVLLRNIYIKVVLLRNIYIKVVFVKHHTHFNEAEGHSS